MKFTRGTAIYTGGGVYVFIGQADNSYYFMADNYGVSLLDSDVRELDDDCEMVAFDAEWLNEHETHTCTGAELKAALVEFVKQLDEGTANETGFEDFENYKADQGKLHRYIEF